MTDEEIVRCAKALAHPARMSIIQMLACEKEYPGSQIVTWVGLAQSTVSEHLRILKEAGLIASRPLGATRAYRLLPRELEHFAAAVEKIVEWADAHGPGSE